ncbi:pyruvate, water dikinase regulatory protein [Hellea balneolensis]|uniref:pyruvate, water dikinase regulatory protein n=1 Tax=Hellea balneolensis TaxID=287478 RepID=UPI0003FEC366|nr:pyruvate, water dikinase regulatory protein [Hellea balneolensis]
MSVPNKSIAIYFHVHLVSDSTGETLVAMMKASTAQFRNATALEHLHALVRSESQMLKTLDDIEAKPGVVLYTLVNEERRKMLENHCAKLNIPAISILDPTLSMLGRYLGAAMISEVGAQRTLDAEYYNRIEALDYAMAHDDGQNVTGLNSADIILLGISRTSKTPTSIYLANRGYKTGNIPLVPNAPLPIILDNFDKPFIVGLVAAPDRIVQIREQRLVGLRQNQQTDYTDADRVRDEMREAKRMFVRKGYKVIDVTRKSIEETSAQIINAYQQSGRETR